MTFLLCSIKKMVVIALIFLVLGLPLHAAGPITHAFLAELFFKQFPKYDSEEQKAFRLGTLFPDVRYLGTIPREETHFPEMTLEEVLEETNPFLAGMKFHSYVRKERVETVSKRDPSRGTAMER